MPHFFFLSSNLRIPRLKKKKKLTIPDISICLAISLETCHVNNNAQLYTIRPSFTAAFIRYFRKNTLLDSPILIPISSSRVRSTRRRGWRRSSSSRVSFDTGEIAIDRSMPVDRAEVNFAPWNETRNGTAKREPNRHKPNFPINPASPPPPPPSLPAVL